MDVTLVLYQKLDVSLSVVKTHGGEILELLAERIDNNWLFNLWLLNNFWLFNNLRLFNDDLWLFNYLRLFNDNIGVVLAADLAFFVDFLLFVEGMRIGTWILDLAESVHLVVILDGFDLVGDQVAGIAEIEIRAFEAFPSDSNDGLTASVAECMMSLHNRLAGISWHEKAVDSFSILESFFESIQCRDLVEFVGGFVGLDLFIVAFGAEIEIRAGAAMISSATDLGVASIADIVMFQFAEATIEECLQQIVALSSLDELVCDISQAIHESEWITSLVSKMMVSMTMMSSMMMSMSSSSMMMFSWLFIFSFFGFALVSPVSSTSSLLFILLGLIYAQSEDILLETSQCFFIFQF